MKTCSKLCCSDKETRRCCFFSGFFADDDELEDEEDEELLLLCDDEEDEDDDDDDDEPLLRLNEDVVHAALFSDFRSVAEAAKDLARSASSTRTMAAYSTLAGIDAPIRTWKLGVRRREHRS